MPTDTPPEFSPAAALRSVGIFAAVCAVQATLVLVVGRGVPCPIRLATGLLCPLCGATTAGMHLLHGRWGQAWASNPFALLLAGGLVLCSLAWVLELAGGPALRPPRRLRPLTQNRVLAVLGVLGLGWALWRNLA